MWVVGSMGHVHVSCFALSSDGTDLAYALEVIVELDRLLRGASWVVGGERMAVNPKRWDTESVSKDDACGEGRSGRLHT
jgi:hypothetical protein